MRTEAVRNACYRYLVEKQLPLDMEDLDMKMTDLFLAELEREGAGTRRTLERVPEGRNDWKPHEKSMQLGYLAALVAKLPSWVAMTIKQNELDFRESHRSSYHTRAQPTRRELL